MTIHTVQDFKRTIKPILEYMLKEECCELLYSEIKDYIVKLQEGIDLNNDIVFEFEGIEHRIIHSSYIDEIWTESLIKQIKECYDFSETIDNLPDFVEFSIDWKATAENCKVDGMGHHFNHYDGSEGSCGLYYVFRLG